MVAGVAAALAGALLLALGAQFQNRGVRASGRDGDGGFGIAQLLGLFRSGRWVIGSGFLTAAVLLQLVGLLLATLPVVQPLGVLSLVATALLGRRFGGTRVTRRGAQGIALCVAGVVAFVTTAAFTTRSSPADPGRVAPVLVLVGVVLTALLVLWARGRRNAPALAFAFAGGACFGFVATLMKVVLDRCAAAVRHGSLFDPTAPFTLLVGAGAALAGIAGISLVQAAYAKGSPDLVVAALTVIDPLVAVTLGIALLGEAQRAPVWAFIVFTAAEAVAIAGVALMARHPPAPLERAPDGS